MPFMVERAMYCCECDSHPIPCDKQADVHDLRLGSSGLAARRSSCKNWSETPYSG